MYLNGTTWLIISPDGRHREEGISRPWFSNLSLTSASAQGCRSTGGEPIKVSASEIRIIHTPEKSGFPSGILGAGPSGGGGRFDVSAKKAPASPSVLCVASVET